MPIPMHHPLAASLALSLACTLSWPAAAQTRVWSQAPTTQRWSEAPPPTANTPAAPTTPATTSPAPGHTSLWAQPVTTQRRSDADIQRQVDGMVRNAEQRARAGQGAWSGPSKGSALPQDQAWRNHIERSRAQEQFQRDQDAYDRRQREYQRR